MHPLFSDGTGAMVKLNCISELTKAKYQSINRNNNFIRRNLVTLITFINPGIPYIVKHAKKISFRIPNRVHMLQL